MRIIPESVRILLGELRLQNATQILASYPMTLRLISLTDPRVWTSRWASSACAHSTDNS